MDHGKRHQKIFRRIALRFAVTTPFTLGAKISVVLVLVIRIGLASLSFSL